MAGGTGALLVARRAFCLPRFACYYCHFLALTASRLPCFAVAATGAAAGRAVAW